MKLEVLGKYDQVSDRAARKIAKALRHSARGLPRRLALLAAAGNTPIGTYRRLVELRKELAGTDKAFDTSAIIVFALDDYWGIRNSDPRSFGNQLRQHLVEPLGLRDDQFVRFDLDVSAEEACRKYDEAVASAGGIGLSILGLGLNGHLGFNEPERHIRGKEGGEPSDKAQKTRIVRLSPITRQHNAGYFQGDISRVPARGITCGFRHLLAARQTLLLVTGGEKHPALDKAYRGGCKRTVPASFLIQAKGDVNVFADLQAWPHTAIARQAVSLR
jgi:glucosamine-6-phosphate deaminase